MVIAAGMCFRCCEPLALHQLKHKKNWIFILNTFVDAWMKEENNENSNDLEHSNNKVTKVNNLSFQIVNMISPISR